MTLQEYKVAVLLKEPNALLYRDPFSKDKYIVGRGRNDGVFSPSMMFKATSFEAWQDAYRVLYLVLKYGVVEKLTSPIRISANSDSFQESKRRAALLLDTNRSLIIKM